MSLGFEAVPAQAQALLSSAADIKDVADIQGLISKLPKGVDPKQLLAKAGLPNVEQLLSQSGLPPAIGVGLKAAGKILGKGGLGAKAGAAADLAQGFLSQTQLPLLGSATGALSGGLQKSLGIANQGGKVGGTAGAAVGTLLFGPVGSAVGAVVGGLIGGTIGKLVPGAKEARLNREKQRAFDDLKRMSAFRYQKPEDFYQAFTQGKVYWTEGVPGTQKWDEKKVFRYKNGQRIDATEQSRTGQVGSKQSGREVLFLDSIQVSQAMLAHMFNVEQKIIARTQKDARAARQQIKQALAAAAAVQQPAPAPAPRAARRARPAQPAAPAPTPASVARHVVKRRKMPAPPPAPQASQTAAAAQVAPPSYEELVRSIFGSGATA